MCESESVVAYKEIIHAGSEHIIAVKFKFKSNQFISFIIIVSCECAQKRERMLTSIESQAENESAHNMTNVQLRERREYCAKRRRK
jgi:hypothetical protein